MPLKTGKRPATHDPRDLLLGRYALERKIPVTPTTDLGHPEFFPSDWKMLGNDSWGDCVFAEGDHATMLWNAEAGRSVDFTDSTALSDYSAVTGFDARDPSTDQGTNMRDAMNYRRKTGLIDARGARHKIGAFVALQPGNVTQLKQCIWLFGSVAVGFEFPASAMDQFNGGDPWTVVEGSPIEGGHDVLVVRYLAADDMFVAVTWQHEQLVAPSFLQKYMDESYGVLSEEMLTGGRSLEGLDVATLTADLSDVGNRTPPTPEPAPAPTDPDDELWSEVRDWTFKRHCCAAKKTAQSLKDWATKTGRS